MDNSKKDVVAMPSNEKCELGYGKPPKDKQFQKGRSGNPSGRPKMRLNVRATLERHLHRRVQARVGDQMTTMTMFEAMIMSLIAAGSRGNLKVIQLILDIVSKPKTLTELMGGRPVFEFTKEEAARCTTEKLMEGMDIAMFEKQPVL
ncbi:DUF5681 domain-containing protein [Reyranella sp.]|uniref:DUF5681 domain-containing protein n=1 Tax=Reyranella sp. TaxID=1929291 RepID=UPI0027305E34|nr:DUF5681 domain-containing protein [Reyranella sp.]MDP2377511.1 DUF5681 domain-containing protein [Reyranella sp.]